MQKDRTCLSDGQWTVDFATTLAVWSLHTRKARRSRIASSWCRRTTLFFPSALCFRPLALHLAHQPAPERHAHWFEQVGHFHRNSSHVMYDQHPWSGRWYAQRAFPPVWYSSPTPWRPRPGFRCSKTFLGFVPITVPQLVALENELQKRSSQKRQARAFRFNVSAKLSKSLTVGIVFSQWRSHWRKEGRDIVSNPWL